MNPTAAKVGSALAVLVIAVVLFVVLKPGDSDNAPSDPVNATGTTAATTPQVNEVDKQPDKPKPPVIPTVKFVNGAPQGGVLSIVVEEGERIRFNVKSDVADEVHVHGFDITEDVAAGGTAKLNFSADFTGIFEAEMEAAGVPVAELQINA